MATLDASRARPNGGAVAAFLGAALGLLVLGVVVLAAELNGAVEEFVFAVGKAWVPGAQGIGPYSGKETFLLVGWLASWGILHVALRDRTLDVKAWFGVALVALLAAILLVWPPVWHALGA